MPGSYYCCALVLAVSKLLVNHHRSTMLITYYNLDLFLQVMHACTILLYWPAGVHGAVIFKCSCWSPSSTYSVKLVLLRSYCLLGFSSPVVA
jgi:hypothetical protein